MNKFVQEIIEIIKSKIEFPPEKIESLIEVPPEEKFGDYAFPCHILSKELKKPPQEIASKLSSELMPKEMIEQIYPIGPYINFKVNREKFAEYVLQEIFERDLDYGSDTQGKGKTIVMDYSHPNIAKPFGIGHLRSTVIGNALYNIFKKLGYEAIRINHLGDWGTQFGQLIVAFKKWGPELKGHDSIKETGLDISKLNELYVRFHKEAKDNPSLEDEARDWFKKLENGNEEARETWQYFKDISLSEFERVYKKLGVKFDSYAGESFYNDMLDDTVKRIKDAGLTEISEEALIVNLEKYDMPPCILRKKDDASLYATRDICAAEYRKREYDFDKMIYVVGSEQRLHFKQFFKVLELMGYEWINDCVHVDFGLIKFKGGKMSTREGKVILLEDLLGESCKIAREIIEGKASDLENKAEVANDVGIGAIIFSELSTKRVKDVMFDWDEILNFDGETGPYVQYTHARLCSVLRKCGEEVTNEIDYDVLKEDDELLLVKKLESFPLTIIRSAQHFEPSILSKYLLDLCSTFNRFYQHHRILIDDKEVKKARILLVDSVRQVIKNGLSILGLKAPERM